MNNEMAQQEIVKRIIWVDYAKAIGILLVVWGHMLQSCTGEISVGIHSIIYGFHMPLFFS